MYNEKIYHVFLCWNTLPYFDSIEEVQVKKMIMKGVYANRRGKG